MEELLADNSRIAIAALRDAVTRALGGRGVGIGTDPHQIKPALLLHAAIDLTRERGGIAGVGKRGDLHVETGANGRGGSGWRDRARATGLACRRA